MAITQHSRNLSKKPTGEEYGRGRDPRCEDCMVHVGYEPSAVLGVKPEVHGYVESCSNGSSPEATRGRMAKGRENVLPCYRRKRIHRQPLTRFLIEKGERVRNLSGKAQRENGQLRS